MSVFSAEKVVHCKNGTSGKIGKNDSKRKHTGKIKCTRYRFRKFFKRSINIEPVTLIRENVTPVSIVIVSVTSGSIAGILVQLLMVQFTNNKPVML